MPNEREGGNPKATQSEGVVTYGLGNGPWESTHVGEKRKVAKKVKWPVAPVTEQSLHNNQTLLI